METEEIFNAKEGIEVKPKSKAKPQIVVPATEIQSQSLIFVHRHKNGKPILTLETLRQFADEKKLKIRYNIIAKEVEIFVPGENFPIENQFALGYAYILSALKAHHFDLAGLDEILLLLANQNIYNPVADWIKSKPWDKKRRLKDIYDTIEAQDNPTKEAILFRWMITAVAALFEPEGVGAAGMLVLQGKQHIGKTYWLRQLLPEGLRHFFKSGLSLDPHDKDSVKTVVSHWIVELGEIDATFRKSDIAALKAFITEQYDTYRPQYARKSQTMPRRTVLAGTVNNPYFLADQTGNRRFWVIECLKLDSRHSIDMQQVWAEVYEYYENNEKWELTEKELELINTQNEEHEMLDYVTEKIMDFYDWNLPCIEWKSASQIADSMGIRNVGKGDIIKIGQTVLRMNGGLKRRSNNKRLLAIPMKDF